MLALPEAKQFVALHARHMGVQPTCLDAILGRIESLSGEGSGSWVEEWSAEAETALLRRDPLSATTFYNLARFPCADTEPKAWAAGRCAETFGAWLQDTGAGVRRVASVDGCEVPFLFRAARRLSAPLLILMGGIVSLKEQWGSFLKLGSRLGYTVAIVDFPGVGENRVPYRRSAAQLYGAIMHAVRLDCDVTRTIVVAPSFGGHLAILQAQVDPRICGIVTVGAPLRQFFADVQSRAPLPIITRMALQQAAGASAEHLDRHLADLALDEGELSAIRVPVTYIASLRDEIIPQEEWRHAAALTARLRVHVFDDVHGAPNHLRETRLLILSVLLRHAGYVGLGRLVETGLRLQSRFRSTRSLPV
jgi:esterase FrsA